MRPSERPLPRIRMAGYKVLFKKSVERDFGSIPKKDVKRILKRIKMLGKEPRPQGCEKLTGQLEKSVMD